MTRYEIEKLTREQRKLLAKATAFDIMVLGEKEVFNNSIRFELRGTKALATVRVEDGKTTLTVSQTFDSLYLDIDTMQATYRCCGTRQSWEVVDVIFEAIETVNSFRMWNDIDSKLKESK